MPDPDFRALCAELLAIIPASGTGNPASLVVARARAALAQQHVSQPYKLPEPVAPKPVAPTDEDVTELFYRHMGEGSEVGFENAIAEALARWGTPAIQPEPVALSPKEVDAQEAFTQLRDEILHLSGPLEVNEVLGSIDYYTPEWV